MDRRIIHQHHLWITQNHPAEQCATSPSSGNPSFFEMV